MLATAFSEGGGQLQVVRRAMRRKNWVASFKKEQDFVLGGDTGAQEDAFGENE